MILQDLAPSHLLQSLEIKLSLLLILIFGMDKSYKMLMCLYFPPSTPPSRSPGICRLLTEQTSGFCWAHQFQDQRLYYLISLNNHHIKAAFPASCWWMWIREGTEKEKEENCYIDSFLLLIPFIFGNIYHCLLVPKAPEMCSHNLCWPSSNGRFFLILSCLSYHHVFLLLLWSSCPSNYFFLGGGKHQRDRQFLTTDVCPRKRTIKPR